MSTLAHNTNIIVSAMIAAFSRKFPSEKNNKNLGYMRDVYETLKLLDDGMATQDIGTVYRRLASILNDEADNLRDESHTTTVDR